MKQSLYIRLQNPQAVLWEGQVTSVSSRNHKGNFDVLPGHANFITLVGGNPIRIRLLNQQEKEFVFKQAVLYVRNNFVSVYTF